MLDIAPDFHVVVKGGGEFFGGVDVGLAGVGFETLDEDGGFEFGAVETQLREGAIPFSQKSLSARGQRVCP